MDEKQFPSKIVQLVRQGALAGVVFSVILLAGTAMGWIRWQTPATWLCSTIGWVTAYAMLMD